MILSITESSKVGLRRKKKKKYKTRKEKSVLSGLGKLYTFFQLYPQYFS